MPGGDSYAFVTRWERRPNSEVYAWSVREPRPVIPIPLQAPDADVAFDPQAVFDQVFRHGRFRIDYRDRAPGSYSEATRRWIEDRGRSA